MTSRLRTSALLDVVSRASVLCLLDVGVGVCGGGEHERVGTTRVVVGCGGGASKPGGGVSGGIMDDIAPG